MGLIRFLCLLSLLWISGHSQESDCGKAKIFDLMFFVHYSSGNLQHFKDFIKNVLSAFDFHNANIKIGLKFIPWQQENFNLTRVTNKEEILAKIESVKQQQNKGDTKWHPFFQDAHTFFEKGNGGRPGYSVPQFAVVLTDYIGEEDLRNSAIKLYLADVMVYTVYVGNQDSSKLFSIASYPYKTTALNALSFEHLNLLWPRLKEEICYKVIHQLKDYWNLRGEVEKSCSKHFKADIYFLLDGSGSVTSEEFQQMKVFVNSTVEFFPVRPSVRVGAAQYSTKTRHDFLLGQYDKNALRCHIHFKEQEKKKTNIENGLNFVDEQFNSTNRTNTSQYLVALMQGTNDAPITTVMSNLRDKKVSIYTIGDDPEFLQLKNEYGTSYHVSSFIFLKNFELHLAKSICETAALQSMEADVIFLLASSSFSSSMHNRVKDLLKHFVKAVMPEKNRIRIAVLQYSNVVREEFGLNTNSYSEEYQKAIDKMRPMQGNILTGKALRYILEHFHNKTGNNETVLVLITEQPSKDAVSQPAEELRSVGTDIYAIQTSDVDISHLQKITGSKEKVLHMHNSLSTVVDILKERIQLQCVNQEIADILFVVDVSTGVGMEELKSFIVSVVKSFDIGSNNVHVGVTLYGGNAIKAFGLSTHQSASSLEDAIKNLNPKAVLRNARNTSGAIAFSKAVLLDTKGRRRKLTVPKFLVTLVHKNSTNRTRLTAVCDDARASGIYTLAVGINYSNTADLRTIGGSDDRYISVNSYQNLKFVSRRVTQQICSMPYCDTASVDIVFLIDGSESISKKDFEQEKTFVKRVVESFNIYDNVRIGLAQFSSDCEIHFKMRVFNPRSDFIKEIDSVIQKPNSTKLVKALEVMTDLFISDQKRDLVTPHLIVMTDGKDEFDSVYAVAEAAKYLRNKTKVDIVAVAVGSDIDQINLNNIAGSKSNVITVSSHADLEKIVPRVVRAVCESPYCNESLINTTTPPPTTPPWQTTTTPLPQNCLIDIAVGIETGGNPGEPLLAYHNQLSKNLLPALKKLAKIRLTSCQSKTTVRFGFHVTNTVPPVETPFQTLDEVILRRLRSSIINRSSRLDEQYLLSFAEKFRRYSDTSRLQVALIFTNGLDASVMELKAASNSLKQDGVRGLITVALEGTSQEAIQQLHTIEFGPFGTGPCCRAQLLIGDLIAGELHSAFVTFSEEACCSCCVCVGPPGPKGDRGRDGIKGNKGQKGAPGHMGDDGPMGRSGEPGKDGMPGYKGCAGPRGPKGNRGLSGNKGENGVDGWNGVQGWQGDDGKPGSKGLKGDPGNQGEKGPEGVQGTKGKKGFPGDPGPPGLDNLNKGENGDGGFPGPEGDPGPEGLDGEDGDPGNQGRSGRKGPIGFKGLRGEDGQAGLEGETGLRGIQGQPGLAGSKGEFGESGHKGPQGSHGQPGVKGSKGNRGKQGLKGQPGDTGDKGQVGYQGFRGPPGSDGREEYGSPGPKGIKGAPGNHGPAGIEGEPGEMGSKGGIGPKGIHGAPGIRGSKGQAGETGDPGYDGRMGQKGPPGSRDHSDCDLIDLIRKNCACQGCRMCPPYPLDLVIAYDMSGEVLNFQLNNMKNLIRGIVTDTHISENTCPSGARVAVLSFSSSVKRIISFTDYNTKKKLLQLVDEKVVYERGGSPRNLAETMRYTARHIFKRIRSGKNVKKMAIFLTRMYMGRGDFARVHASEGNEGLLTAAMELHANDITPVIVTTIRPDSELSDAFLDFPGPYEIISDFTNLEQILARLRSCFLCYDPCHPDQSCATTRPAPVQLDADILFLLDGSHSVRKAEYEHARQFLYGMVDRFGSPHDHSVSLTGARLALVQLGGRIDRGQLPVHVEFDFQHVNTKEDMKEHIKRSMQQLQGSLDWALALEYIMRNVFTTQPKPRSKKVIFNLLTGPSDLHDQGRLQEITLKAKCNGYILFSLALRSDVLDSEIDLLSCPPVSAHSCQLDKPRASDIEYAIRFAESFFRFLKKRPLGDSCGISPDDCKRVKPEELRVDIPLHSIQMQSAADVMDLRNEAPGPVQTRLESPMDKPILSILDSYQSDTPLKASGVNLPQSDHPQSTQHPTSFRGVEKWDNSTRKGAAAKTLNIVYSKPETDQEKPESTALEQKPSSDSHQLESAAVGLKGKQVTLSVRCLQHKDYGQNCRGSQGIHWYFNKQIKKCAAFWYSGCGGNGNRFTTQAACRQHCAGRRIP